VSTQPHITSAIRPKLQLPAPSDAAPATPSSKLVYAYFSVLLVAVIGVATWLMVAGYSLGPEWAIPLLGVVALVAERGAVRLNRSLEVSISPLPRLFAAVVFGPLAAMVVGAMSMLGDLRPPYLRWAVYTCTRSLTSGIAGLAAYWAGGLVENSLGSIAIATLAAVGVGEFLDLVFCAVTVRLRKTETIGTVVGDLLPVLPTQVLLYTAVVACLAFAYLELSAWSVFFFLLPALAAQRLFLMYQAQRELARDLGVLNQTLERANRSFAEALVATLDARDRYTAGHSTTVAVYAKDIAQRLRLSDEEVRLAHLAGMVHDIGKIGVPAGILEKPGALTLQERRMMEEHSAIGERILANVEAYAEIAMIVRHHHERIDGLGYPDGLGGHDIPLVSRIICVADAYNAMTSDRPYRDALPCQVARERLREGAGSQFDGTVVEAFDEILETAMESYTRGTRSTLVDIDEARYRYEAALRAFAA
jgi:putative nucleotidyltransferase with HDIG domain